jgi:hypothetical protein
VGKLKRFVSLARDFMRVAGEWIALGIRYIIDS